MLPFEFPMLGDADWINQSLKEAQFQSCEYNFAAIMMWWKSYGIKCANVNGYMVGMSESSHHATYFYPAGKDALQDSQPLRQVLQLLEEDAAQRGKKFCIVASGKEQREVLEKVYGERAKFYLDRDYCEYIYSRQKMVDLSGKKLHGKRNHISYFTKTFQWTYETMTEQNIPDCLAMNREWEKIEHAIQDNSEIETLDWEKDGISAALKNFKQLNITGGVLRIDGKVVAFTYGSPISDTVFDIQVEKAFADIRGAYPMINREFAKNELSAYQWVNREEDMGHEGLRKAKLSYYPEILLEKYYVEIAP